MKILHYCAHMGGFVYDWHHYHMIDELRRARHEVIYLNPAQTLGRSGTPAEYSQVLLDQIKDLVRKSGVDLFFATATDDTVVPSAIDEIRRLGICTVNLSCDDLSHPFRVKKVASSFDLNWTTVRENEHILKGYGANLITMPWGANPHIFKPAKVKEERVVGFVGSAYGARARHLAEIAIAELPLQVYGQSPQTIYASTRINHPLVRAIKDFKESGHRIFESLSFTSGRLCVAGSIKRSLLETISSPPEKHIPPDTIIYKPGPPFEKLGDCFNRMAVSLGSIELSSTYVLKNPLLFIRLREFEVPMCGGVHLVNRFTELTEYFEEDREMLFYGSGEELLDKARFYLAPERDQLRQSIRERARKRATADHTWLKRFQQVGQRVGLRFM